MAWSLAAEVNWPIALPDLVVCSCSAFGARAMLPSHGWILGGHRTHAGTGAPVGPRRPAEFAAAAGLGQDPARHWGTVFSGVSGAGASSLGWTASLVDGLDRIARASGASTDPVVLGRDTDGLKPRIPPTPERHHVCV